MHHAESHQQQGAQIGPLGPGAAREGQRGQGQQAGQGRPRRRDEQGVQPQNGQPRRRQRTAEDRDAAGENLKDPKKRNLGDALKQRGDR